MTRSEILDAAKVCVCGGREQDYGEPEDNFSIIANFWNTYLNKTGAGESICLLPRDVAIMMALLKIARTVGSSKPDSFVDLAGYAACAGELSCPDETGD